MEKVCTKCHRSLSLEEFHNKLNGKHGKHSECKICICKRTAIYAIGHKERILNRQKIYDKKRREEIRQFANIARDKELKSLNENAFEAYESECEKNMKKQARIYLNTAVQLGYLIKPMKCEKCAEKDYILEGHHKDYLKPCRVDWLCKKCHWELHGKFIKNKKPIKWKRIITKK